MTPGGGTMTHQLERSRARSAVGTVALVATAVSAIGLLVMLVGNAAGWTGFSDSPDDNSTVADLMWLAFSAGGLVALVGGIAAWVLGARKDRGGDVRAGMVAIGYLVAAVVITILWDAFVA